MAQRFENIIIIGRPGSGKSEIIDLLRKAPLAKRIRDYHVGDFIEIDDFVWLNEKLREDDLWEEMGKKRRYSIRTSDGCLITSLQLWDFLIELVNKEAGEKYLSDNAFYNTNTLFIEFSRGGAKTYKDTLSRLTDAILQKSAILHLDITYEESLERNELRYREGKEESKLHHKVPLEQMELSYKTSDWLSLSLGRDQGLLDIRGFHVPFVSLRNHPAPKNEDELERRIMPVFHTLFTLKYGDESTLTSRTATSGETFDHLFVLGRPASGKSEFIDFVKKTPILERVEQFHIGAFEEMDDYPMLAEKFQEEDIWQKLTGMRPFTALDPDGPVITDLSLFNFAAERINHLILQRYVPNPPFYDDHTLLIEFSRGMEIGYQETLGFMDARVLEKGAIFYIKTSPKECQRRNIARYEEKKKFSILAHKVPEQQMQGLYRDDDWDTWTEGKDSGWLVMNGVKVPFVVLDNEIESKDPKVLAERYGKALDTLADLYREAKKKKPLRVTSKRHFENLFVFGRPAGGKSEFIDYMKKCEAVKRQKKYAVAPFEVIDDFLSLWEIGENEDILAELALPKKITELTSDGVVVTDGIFWDFVSEKINRTVSRSYLSRDHYYDEHTLLLEFSRGKERDGYEHSLALLKPEILRQGAILYIDVSYEEALRRNETRYREKLKHSVLAHKVPEKAMERFYREDDWRLLTKGKSSGFVTIKGVDIPFVTMNNESESKDILVLEERYEQALQNLFTLWCKKSEAKSSSLTAAECGAPAF